MKKISKEHRNLVAKLEKIKEIPRAHQDLVLSRLEKIKGNPERLLDWDEVSNTFAFNKSVDRKIRLNKIFGAVKLSEDAVTLQRRWRDEG
jgi:hypothetical protein